MSLTRLSLLTRLRNDEDLASWKEFHTAYHPLLSRYCVSQRVPLDDVPDVVQEIFAKLIRVLRRFQYDPQRARFRTWLLRIARNQITDWCRKRNRRREEVCAPDQLAEVSESVEEFDWDAEHRLRVLEHALQSVRRDSQSLTWTCFVQHHLQRRTAPEIALATGLTESGVYTNAARILKRVRNKCLQFDEVLDDAGSPQLSRRRRPVATG